jgi:uncharacterized DUF497 family protein
VLLLVEYSEKIAAFNVATFGVTMHFEWDAVKNRANVRKHGFDFVEAEAMFRGLLIVSADLAVDYGEHRWQGIAAVRTGIAVVVFTLRDAETVRIISLRKANREERKEYEKTFHDGLEAH